MFFDIDITSITLMYDFWSLVIALKTTSRNNIKIKFFGNNKI
jgi:hypothetical protein